MYKYIIQEFRNQYLARKVPHLKRSMNKRLFIVSHILMAFFTISAGQVKGQNPYLKLQYDSVVIYDLVTEGGEVSADFETDKSYRKRARLDERSINRLSKKLGEKRSFGVRPSICFDPHLGITYYRQGKPVAVVNVCLDCNNLESSLALRSQVRDRINDDGTQGEYLSGMSKSFRRFLNALMAPHNFSHQIVPGQEPWD